MELEYELFDNLTLNQAVNATDFIPNREDFLSNEESSFITYSIEKELENDVVYSGNLEKIISSWDMESKVLNDELDEINTIILSSIKKLALSVVDYSKFDSFLDDLVFVKFEHGIKITSKHTPSKFMWCTDGYLIEAVGEYIRDLVDNEIIFLDGFEVWDEFFALTLASRF